MALQVYGASRKLLAAVQSLYEDGWARVRVGGRESTLFQAKNGVRHGCPLSPWLFNIDSNRSKEEILWQCAANYRAVKVAIVVDDLVMLAGSEEALQHNLQELNDRLDEWGMKANW